MNIYHYDKQLSKIFFLKNQRYIFRGKMLFPEQLRTDNILFPHQNQHIFWTRGSNRITPRNQLANSITNKAGWWEYTCEAQAVPWVRATQASMRRSLMSSLLSWACVCRTYTQQLIVQQVVKRIVRWDGMGVRRYRCMWWLCIVHTVAFYLGQWRQVQITSTRSHVRHHVVHTPGLQQHFLFTCWVNC